MIYDVGKGRTFDALEEMLGKGVFAFGVFYIYNDPPHGTYDRFELHEIVPYYHPYDSRIRYGSRFLLGAPTLEKLVRINALDLGSWMYIPEDAWYNSHDGLGRLTTVLGMQQYDRLFPVTDAMGC